MSFQSWGSIVIVALGVLALIISIALYAAIARDDQDTHR